MTEADYIKALLDLYKMMLAGIIGIVFVMFWNLIQNIHTLEKSTLKGGLFLSIFIAVSALLCVQEYWKLMHKLRHLD